MNNMNDEIKTKHVLGALTLSDIKDRIRGLEVRIDEIIYVTSSIMENQIELWETFERLYDNDPPDRSISLDTQIRLRDGNVILDYPETGIEEEMTFGRTEFIPVKIEIDLKS